MLIEMKPNFKHMETTSRRIKLSIESLPEGEVMISLAEENWGPVVTGKSREDAEKKFLEALRVTCIVESLRSITEYKENHDLQRLKEVKEKMVNPKIEDADLVYEKVH